MNTYIEEHQRCFMLGIYFMAVVWEAASYYRKGFSICLAVSTRRVMVPGVTTFRIEPVSIGVSSGHGFKTVNIYDFLCDGWILNGWCPGWTQWHNLMPLEDGFWLWWWNFTGGEVLTLAPNKNIKNNLQLWHRNKERTVWLQSELQILSDMVIPYSQHQFSHKACWTWYLWRWDN